VQSTGIIIEKNENKLARKKTSQNNIYTYTATAFSNCFTNLTSGCHLEWMYTPAFRTHYYITCYIIFFNSYSEPIAVGHVVIEVVTHEPWPRLPSTCAEENVTAAYIFSDVTAVDKLVLSQYIYA